MFTNDLFDSQTIEEWTLKETFVGNRVRIGSNATILADIKIGDGARVGAGAVVVRNVADGETVVGNPAYPVGNKCSQDVGRTQTRSQ